MNNDLINGDNIETTPPTWQHPILPSPAVQGSLLITTNNFTTPPQDSSLFKFIPMEKLIGVANVKMEYNDVLNKFTIYKAKGHLYNNDQWEYDWEPIGSFENITPEAQEQLLALVYVNYRYDTSTQNTLKVYGIKKSGEEDLLCNIVFISDTVFNTAVQNLQDQIDAISQGTIYGGLATDITTDSENKKHVNVRYDGNDFTVDNNNNLKSNLIDDTSTTDKAWSAQQILNYMAKNAMKYKGSVNDISFLPTTADKDDVYLCTSEYDLFVNISNDPQSANWQPFTKIASTVNTYAIELHKSANGLYGQLRYDNIDFIIDNFNNLKSQIIDDTMDASSVNANKKTYSIFKILQLISQAMHYKGQVATYTDLPATGNVNGDVWNVQDTGDNYAWNGTGWDNLSGEYIAGAGIVITGKTISATGISFVVGAGLQATGSGSTTTLLTKNGNGIEYDNGNALQVKKGSGISINANGVNVNTGYTTKLVNDNLEVDYSDGLTQDSNNKLAVDIGNGLVIDINKVKINANFIIDTNPLGTDSSNIVLYSDGKIGIRYETTVLEPTLLKEILISDGQAYIQNQVIPDFNNYNVLLVSMGIVTTYPNSNLHVLGWIDTNASTMILTQVVITGWTGAPGTSLPTGYQTEMVYGQTVDKANNTIGLIGVYYTSNSSTWNFMTSGQKTIKFYGLKLKNI